MDLQTTRPAGSKRTRARKQEGRRQARRASSYTAADITVLEGLEAVRKRPGMYVGSTGERGLHHLVYEVVDNSVDEALAGFCDSVQVLLHPDNSVTVIDNGRGIPVDMHEKEKRPAAEVVLTVLHAGGKFGEAAATRCRADCTASACRSSTRSPSDCDLEVRRDGHVWTQSYERGVPQGELKKGEQTSETGTTITFLPDLEIFEEVVFDFETLTQRMRETAFLTKGLRHRADRRARLGRARRVPLRGRHQGLRRLPERRRRTPIHRKIVYFEQESPRTVRPRSRCSGTPRTRSRSSALPTTSTRPRAARTCRAFAPR